MWKDLLALFAGVALLGVLGLAAVYIADRFVTSPADRAFRAQFLQVERGMTEAQVVELLGPSDERSTEFFLGQRSGSEDAYMRAAESNSSYFLVWRRGVDVVYSVGFSAEGKATIAEVGGT